MEQFLETLDMSNLRSIIENDSDYGDETEQVSRKGGANMSLSVTSVQAESAISNLKSSAKGNK